MKQFIICFFIFFIFCGTACAEEIFTGKIIRTYETSDAQTKYINIVANTKIIKISANLLSLDDVPIGKNLVLLKNPINCTDCIITGKIEAMSPPNSAILAFILDINLFNRFYLSWNAEVTYNDVIGISVQ
jgi:hypothetical protein